MMESNENPNGVDGSIHTSTNAHKKSQQLFERALKVAPGGVHSPVRAFKSVGGQPVFFSEATGAFLKSVDGRRYVDFCQSFGPMILGHRDPDVMKAVEKATSLAWTFGACEPYSLYLAEWLVENISFIEKVRFTSSGTEAVMSALRLARAVTGRTKLLKFEGCYHGHMDSMLVKAGSGLAGVGASDSAGVTANTASETLVCPLNDLEAVTSLMNEHGDQIAAIVVEPLPANFGLLIQSQEFLQGLRDLATKHGSLLIFDEVLSGFRTDIGGMSETLGITPDLVTYGKVIGGGFPVGCYAGSSQFMDWVAPSGPVYQAGTLSGNPIGMMAGLATLKKVQEKNIIRRLEEKTKTFVAEVTDIFQRESLPFRAISKGSLMWCHGSDKAEPRSLTDLPAHHGENFKVLFHALLEEGVYFAPSGYEVGFMSWAHSDKIIFDTLLAIKSAAEKIKGKLKVS